MFLKMFYNFICTGIYLSFIARYPSELILIKNELMLGYMLM